MRIFSPQNRPLLVALIVAAAFFMELLDGTVIATALPQMARSFHENPVNLSIGISAYLLTLAVFIPSSGWIADRFGSKTIFSLAIAVFTSASVLCGFSHVLWQFTAARILQGIGGAMMVPVGRLVVLRGTDKRDLVRATALVTTPGLVATVLGPPVGGFITTFASWRWIFFLNVPLGLLGLALVFAFMTNHRADARRPFDTIGFLLSGVGLASLMFGIDQVGRSNEDWPLALAVAAFGAGLCGAAVSHARRHPTPILDLSVLRIPTFALGSLVSGSLFRIVIGATPFLWPLLFQLDFGMSAFASGTLIIGCAIGDVAMKTMTTKVLRRYGFRNVLLVNGSLAAIAVLACTLFNSQTPRIAIFVILAVIGVFRSMQFTAINTLQYVDVPPPLMSAASSLASTLQQLTFGMGVAFGALALHVAALLHPGRTAYTLGDFRFAFVAATVLAAASAANFLRLAPNAGAEVSGHRAAGAKATRFA